MKNLGYLPSYIITHPEMGVYLGSCMGMGFWTLLDTAGQDRVCTFHTIDEMTDYIASWEENNDPSLYSFVKVNPSAGDFATISDLKEAGLESLLGKMEVDALRYAYNR